MHFTDIEIELARTLKSRKALWNPTPGQFVLDDDQVFHHTSPFQPHVFFILDLQHFLRYTGTPLGTTPAKNCRNLDSLINKSQIISAIKKRSKKDANSNLCYACGLQNFPTTSFAYTARHATL
jgi:hypothetical protein